MAFIRDKVREIRTYIQDNPNMSINYHYNFPDGYIHLKGLDLLLRLKSFSGLDSDGITFTLFEKIFLWDTIRTWVKEINRVRLHNAQY